MAYTAVKLADVNKAIAAVKTAQSNYATALSSTTPSKTALEAAQKNFEAATAKLQSMRDDFDKQTYLQNNSSYNSALDAAKTAEQKLNEARDFLDSGRYYRDNSTYNNDVNAFNSANDKLNQLRDFKDSGQYLRDNSAYQNAVNAIEPKINALREAENKLDNWSGNRSGSAWNSAVTAKVNASKAVDAAYTARDKAEQAASTAADTLVRNQENARNAAETKFNKTRETLESNANKTRETAEKTLDLARTKIDTVRDTSRNTAEKAVNAQDQAIYKTGGIQSLYDQAKDKYQNLVDQTQSNLDAYKDSKSNVLNYVNDIKNSLGDVNTKEDATAVKTLLIQIETSINGTGISDFKNEIAPLIKEIDPLKMANITTPDTSSAKTLNSAFKNASPSNFSNIDPNTGLPVLNQEALDRVLNKYGDNSLTSGQYRDNYNAFGWNVKSDASSVTRGAALVGLDMGNIQAGMQSSQGYVKAGTTTSATDADFKKAAQELGLDVNNYIQPNKFVPTSGQYGSEKATNKNSREYTNPNTGETYLARTDAKGNFVTSLDKQSLYGEIDNRLKDFYVVGNLLEHKGANNPAPHAAVLFKADGSGNLVPVTKPDGSVAASYYNAASVSHAGWRGQLAELGPLIAVASAIFLPGIGTALAQSLGSATVATTAAVAPTAFTVGLPAASVSLGSVIGATGVNALTGSIINGGMAFLTGGDVGKAMLSGAAGAAAAVSAGDISNKIMGGGQTGASNVAAIAKAANLSVSQTEKIIASGFASGLTSAVTDPDNAFKNMAISIASNFTSEEAKNIVSGSVDPKSVNGVTTFVSNAVDLGTSALMSGQDVGKVLQNAAPSLTVGAAKAESKYAPPVSTGASGFPLSPDRYETAQKEINTYYKDLLNSDFDENVVTQLKKAYPDLPESEVYQKAKDITGDFAAQTIGQSIGDVSQGTLDYLFSSIAGDSDSIKYLPSITASDVPETIQNIKGLQPDLNELGNGIKKRTEIDPLTKQKIVTYEQTISGKTKDGKEYGFTAVYDPNSNNVHYTTGSALSPEELVADASGTFPGGFTQVLDIRPNFNNLDSSEIPAPFIPFETPPQKDLTYLLSEQFSKDQGVMSRYIKEAGNALKDSGIPSPSQQEISKYAMDMLRGDVSNIFGYSPSTSSGKEKSDATEGTLGGVPGGVPKGVPEGLPEGLPEGMPGGTLDGSLEGSKTGGTGTGAGTGGDGGAAAEKAARAKRQNYYNQMMGVASLPTVSTPASTKQTSPSQAFYYGKDFGSPTQAISETGDLVQKPYQALSVTQPGKEVAPTGVTGENDVSALLSNILSQGDETSLNDLLEIIGGSQYG